MSPTRRPANRNRIAVASLLLVTALGTGCADNKAKTAKAADGVPLSATVTNINPAPAAPVTTTTPTDSTYAPPLTGGYAASPAYTNPTYGGGAASPAYSQTPTTAAPVYATTGGAGAATGGSYTVKKGDTLFRIAHDRYGDGKQWPRIAAANPGLSPSTLKVGQRIVVP